MQTLDLARPDRAHELADRHRDVLELRSSIMARHGVRTLVIGWSESLRVVNDDGVQWVFGPWELDPSRTVDGRTVMPARQRRQLRLAARAGLPAQRIAIAHEVPARAPTSRSGEVRTCPADEAARLIGPVPPHPGVTRLLRTLGGITGPGVSAAGSALRATSAALLDPIVFAAVAPTEPTEGEPAVWIPLVAWRW